MNQVNPRHPSVFFLLPAFLAVICGLSPATLFADVEKLVVISNDEVVGTLEATVEGRNVQVAYAVDNNGRGPKVNETLVLNEEGYPLSWEIKGFSMFGADVAASYQWQAGAATWRTRARRASSALETGAASALL